MKTVKFTGSIRKALETLTNIIEGKIPIEGTIPGQKKPNWGWDEVRLMDPSKIEYEKEITEEDGGHGKIDVVNVFNGTRTRNVSFWADESFHLATIFLRNDGNYGDECEHARDWEVERIETHADIQLGRPSP